MNRKPYLIQRLLKPYRPIEEALEADAETAGLFQRLANAFSFGGGLYNGGISKKAMNELQKLWRYDYMGSAEFEFGAVPESLDWMAKNRKSLVSGSTVVTARAFDWSESRKKKKEATGTVYYVCPKEFESEVVEWIGILSDETSKTFHTKEAVCIAGNILGEEYHLDKIGWHDIDNDYLFFTDRETFEGFCRLMGVSLP